MMYMPGMTRAQLRLIHWRAIRRSKTRQFFFALFVTFGLLSLLLSGCTSIPGSFAEVGAGVHMMRDCQSPASPYCGPNPLGTVRAGVQFGAVEVAAEHWSSMQSADRGINMLTVRHRWGRGGQ